jgi:hypothetical protein
MILKGITKKTSKILNMKFILTESQFADLFFKRRFAQINSLVEEKMVYYPPCDYTYKHGFNDYYNDVRDGLTYEMVSVVLGLDWVEGNIDKIDEFSNSMGDWMYDAFHDKLRDYFDMIIGQGCEE